MQHGFWRQQVLRYHIIIRCILNCSNHHPSILRLNQSSRVIFSTSFNKDFTCFRIYQVFSNVCPKKTRVLMLNFCWLVAGQRSSEVANDVDQRNELQASYVSCRAGFWFTWTKDVHKLFKRFISTWICWVFADIFFNVTANSTLSPKIQQFRHHLRSQRTSCGGTRVRSIRVWAMSFEFVSSCHG